MDINSEVGVKLLKDIKRCKDLCFEYNNIKPSNEDEKKVILDKIITNKTINCVVTQPFYCDFGYNIELGDYFYSNHNLTILDGAKVTIGSHVFIGPNCCIATANHPLDHEQRDEWIEFAEPITIGNSVWLGAGVNVLPGVTIGKNTVIGAGSVVTKDIPDNVIAAGNPCRVIRKITEADRFDCTKHRVLDFSE